MSASLVSFLSGMRPPHPDNRIVELLLTRRNFRSTTHCLINLISEALHAFDDGQRMTTGHRLSIPEALAR